jgi:hypothetical protein
MAQHFKGSHPPPGKTEYPDVSGEAGVRLRSTDGDGQSFQSSMENADPETRRRMIQEVMKKEGTEFIPNE